MITTIVLNIIYIVGSAILSPLLNLLPTVTLSADQIANINAINTYLGLVDNFLPLGTIFAILGIFLLIEGFIFSYKLIMWAIRRIPGQG